LNNPQTQQGILYWIRKYSTWKTLRRIVPNKEQARQVLGWTGYKLTTSVTAATVSHLRAMGVFVCLVLEGGQTGCGNLPYLLIMCEYGVWNKSLSGIESLPLFAELLMLMVRYACHFIGWGSCFFLNLCSVYLCLFRLQ
jgi:hypothetical protein